MPDVYELLLANGKLLEQVSAQLTAITQAQATGQPIPGASVDLSSITERLDAIATTQTEVKAYNEAVVGLANKVVELKETTVDFAPVLTAIAEVKAQLTPDEAPAAAEAPAADAGEAPAGEAGAAA